MAVIDSGSSGAGKANVNANFELEVHTPTTEANAGFVQLSSEIDSGSVTGSRYVKALEVTDDYRLRVALDSPLFNHSFEGTIVARDRIQQNDTTMTAAQASGFLSINSANATASGNACNIKTYRTFPLFGTYPLYCELWLREGNPTATNAVSEWGLGYAATTATPTDGIFFRRLSGGQLRGIVNFAGSETTVDITTTNVPSRDGVGAYDATEANHYLINCFQDEVEFWINNTLVGQIDVPSTQGSPASSAAQPLFARVYNSGVASAGRRVEIGFINVSLGDSHNSKNWAHQMCGSGGGFYQIQPGTTSGPTVTRGAVATAGWPNSAQARGAGTWTATSAPATASLGGQWVSPAISTLTSEADYPVFAYLNPAGTATLPGKTLYITGIKWGNTVATAAASTNSINLNYIVGVGSTGSGTAVTEAAAAVAARGVVLDVIPFKSTSAIGDYVPGGYLDLSNAPLVVPPACYLHFIVRPYGTVTSNTLVVNSTVAFVGYHE
jgi:hypothetical protein